MVLSQHRPAEAEALLETGLGGREIALPAGQPAEVVRGGLLRIAGLKLVPKTVDGEDVGLFGGRDGEGLLQLQHDLKAAALLGGPRPALVHQHPPHHPRRDTEEMETVLPVHAPLIEEAQIDLVHEARRLDGGLVAQQQARQSPQLFVDDRDQVIEPVALFPLLVGFHGDW